MHLQPENIHYDYERGFYWTRVHATFEDGTETIVLVGAGKNYLNDHFKIPSDQQLQDAHVDKWLQEALIHIAATVSDASQEVHYLVYSLSDEGKQNGHKFLMEEVIP